MMPDDVKTGRGTIVKGIGSFYTVRTSSGLEYVLRCKKKFRYHGMVPLIGDEILFIPGQGEEDGWIEEILPRKTLCLRPPVANVTLLIIVLAPVPEPDLLLTDKLACRARAQQMDVVIVANKVDINPEYASQIQAEYREAKIDVYRASASTGEGLDALKEAMKGKICCLTGQSGVGKSSLINALFGLRLETGDISRKIERGKNTTRLAELIEKDGIRVMDTAGFSLLEGEKELEPEKLRERYPEFYPFEGKCRFHECLHDREPGCAVDKAASEGIISKARLARYRQLLAEAKENWRNRYD